ncbi:histidine kinase [Phyllobacterium sp. YR620]|uniref:cache domain-containing sensor histidine kinase n=1 Tax=Phyllobacterium sp. YR620 TaxID=1881066 RepID=UPI000B89A621|nr:histidine kinase [Phyllobacterium sp. YR620]
MSILRRSGDRWALAGLHALLRRLGLMAPAGKALSGSVRSHSRPLELLPYGLLLFLSVAAIILVFIIGVGESRDRMITESTVQLRQKTALLEAYVSKILEANEMVLRNISSEIDPMPWSDIVASPKVASLLADQKQFLKHSGVIALVNREGSLVAYSEGFPAKSFSVTDRDYYRYLHDNPLSETFIGEPLIGRVHGKLSLTMSKALHRQDGLFDGLILITMPLEYFSNLFNGAASPSDVAQLLRNDGRVIVNVPFAQGGNQAPLWFASAVGANPAAGVVNSVSASDQTNRLVAYRKVEAFPFYVSYAIDEGKLLNGWWQSVFVYGAVLATALAAFMATAWMARRNSIALLHSNESLREVSERVLVSQDEERRSIARDLHDSTGQHLIGAAMELDSARSRVSETDDDTSRALHRAAALIMQSNEELRTLSYLLHPPMLDESGLPNALELLVVGFEERSGLEIELRVAPEIGTKRPPAGVELAIFRIVQEALTNIYRHARASHATIRLVRQGSDAYPMLSLTVKDDGIGIERRNRNTIGVGLSGMEARLRPFNGLLDISTGKKGTTLSVRVRG